MTYTDLHASLTQSLISVNDNELGGIFIVYEGQDFDPEKFNGDIFIAENYIFSGQESLSKDTLDEVTGIYQLTIYQRSNLGQSDILRITDGLTSYYVHNRVFTTNQTDVVIINSGRDEGIDLDGWYVVPVSISFKVDKLRGI